MYEPSFHPKATKTWKSTTLKASAKNTKKYDLPYLLKYLTRQTGEGLPGDNCYYKLNVKTETLRLPGTLTLSIKRKISIILSKQGIFRTSFP